MPADSRPGPFRVFFGDEDHLINLDLEKIRSGSSREVTLFDGDGLDARELVSFCESHFSNQQGVIVEEAQKIKQGDALLKFIENRDPSDKSLFLLFVIRSDTLKEGWAKAAAKLGRPTQYRKPKPWETDKQVARIHNEAQRLGLKLEEGVPEALLRFLGYDLVLIANELKKASHLVDQHKMVTKDSILSLIPQVFPVQPYEVAEAAAAKKPKQAMTLLSFVYRNMGEGASIPVTYALMRLVEKLLIARSLSDRGASAGEVAGRLDMHEYAYKMNLMPLVRRHSVSQLIDQMQTLCKLDTLVKGSSNSKRTHVELMVLSLATQGTP